MTAKGTVALCLTRWAAGSSFFPEKTHRVTVAPHKADGQCHGGSGPAGALFCPPVMPRCRHGAATAPR